MKGAFFSLVGLIVLVAVLTSLANRDYVSAAVLIPLGLGLPILYKAAS